MEGEVITVHDLRRALNLHRRRSPTDREAWKQAISDLTENERSILVHDILKLSRLLREEKKGK